MRSAMASLTGKSPRLPRSGKGLVEVDRGGVVDARANPGGVQVGQDVVAAVDLHDVEVPDGEVARSGRPGRNRRTAYRCLAGPG